MKRVFIVFAALTLVSGGVACSEQDEQTARDVADEAEDAAEDAAERAGDAANEAADRAEDVVNDRTVNIDDNAFEPDRLTVSVGTEVTWVNQDDVQHTVTADDDGFESDELDEGDEFSNRFTDDGTFDYHCEIHGEDTMSGTIVVEN